MSAFISRKQSFLILLAGLCAAAAATFLLNYFLAGPRLGVVYDFLRDHRPEPPVSQEIVIIDTDELIESGDLFTVLMTLTELQASGLIVEVPVLGASTIKLAGDEEILRRFNDEYTLLGKNIRNLFEAIRVGSVSPAESAGYVENLVELAERGRDRLTTALIRQDEAGSVQTAQAATVFGAVFEAGDLRSQPPDLAVIGSAGPWYSRPHLDRDGKLRRIAPFEHIVYRSLKARWTVSDIEYTEQGPVLVNMNSRGEELRIPLDRDSNILIEKPPEEKGGGMNFRRLSLERFREYEEADRAMGLLLRDAEPLGVYSETVPERIPLFLREYAGNLREELLEAAVEILPSAWIAARAEYLASLEDLLYGPSEMILINGFEEIIAAEQLKDEGYAKLQTLRDEMIRFFVAMREQHRRLIETRNLLDETLAASICLMGPLSSNGADPIKSSALLANALLSGCHIIPGRDRYILFWSLTAVCIVLLCVHALRPALVLGSGTAAALLCTAAFCWSFIISGYWIDPFIPAAACMAGILVIFSTRLLLIRRGAQRFRLAYGPAVSKACLKELIRTGQPLLSEIITVPAAVIAIKDSRFASPGEEPPQTIRMAAEFRKAAALASKQAGAVVISYGEDTVLSCFGSPPELISGRDSAAIDVHPADRAAAFVAALLRQTTLSWHFGVDFGPCAFSWSAETGYTAAGRPVTLARRLSSINARCRTRAVITGTIQKKTSQPVQKLKVPQLIKNGELYELLTGEQNGTKP